MTPEDYLRHDAVGLAGVIRKGEATAAEVLETALTLADRVNPALNAVTVDLRDMARARVREPLTGPFAGVPFLLKDLGADWEGTIETGGSQFFAESRGSFTRTVVQRYLDAGLVIFGRTASPEMGINFLTEPALHGPCRNPWNLEHSPGGSSGGAAALVAAGVVPAAQASDGGGSIRMPAHCCGLVGLKPSRGRIPSGPKIGESWSGLAGAHVLSRTVRDSAAFLDAAKGMDEGQPYNPANAHLTFADCVAAFPQGLRIGYSDYARELAPTNPEIYACMTSTAQLLGDLGHIVDEITPDAPADEVEAVLWDLVSVNMRAGIKAVLRERGLDALPHDAMEPATRACMAATEGMTAEDFLALLARRDALTRRFSLVFRQVDILMTPVMPDPAPPIGALEWRGEGFAAYRKHMMRFMPYTPIQNIAGLPAISLPLGITAGGLPIGLMFTAAYGREDLLLSISAQLEQAIGGFNRIAPLIFKDA